MAFRHEVLHVRRQKQRLIDIPRPKILAHSQRLNQTRLELNSDYSDRLLEHDPEKWVPVFPRDKREAFARRSCSNKKIGRDDEPRADSEPRTPASAPIDPTGRRRLIPSG